MVITLLPRISRSGSFITPSYTIPAGTKGNYSIRANILNADLNKAGNTGTINIETSNDGGNTWDFYCGMTFCSDPSLTKGIGIGGIIDQLAGKLIRAIVILDQPITTGFNLEII